MTAWRLIRDDGATAAGGLAVDEALARRVGAGASPPTLRLYTYRPHVALIGRFQDAANELHLDACRANDVQVNRRPTGGGAILMGPDQLGVALVRRARGHARDQTARARETMARFSAGLVAALESLGIRAAFRGKNDLEVDGRKIAGLGIHREPSGGLLFHASLLVDLDVALMTRVLRIPMERNGDVERLARRMATVRGLLGHEVSLDDVRARVAGGFADAFDVSLEPGALDRPERLDVEALERRKYLTGDWVFQRTEVPDAAGAATLDTPGGTLDVRVALAGRMIKSVLVTGDFFADDGALADLEGRLRWHACRADAVGETVLSWARTHGTGTLAPDDLAEAIVAAVRDAGVGGAKGEAPYACFAPSTPYRTREVALG